jgi:hypothetical protein
MKKLVGVFYSAPWSGRYSVIFKVFKLFFAVIEYTDKRAALSSKQQMATQARLRAPEASCPVPRCPWAYAGRI